MRGTPYLEQIDDAPRLGLAHVNVAPVPDVAAKEYGPEVRRERIDERPEPLHSAPAGVLLAGKNVDAERDSRPADEEAVVVVARTSGLDGVVAKFRPLLMPVYRLDRVVDVEYVPEREQDFVHFPLVFRQPFVEILFVRLPECPADGRVGDHLAQAKQLARGLVVPQRLDVDVPGLPKQDREHGGAEDVAVRAGVVASVVDGEVPAEPVEEPRGLQEHRKVRKPPCGGDLRAGSPIDFEPPSECGNVDGAAKPPDEFGRLRHLQPERSCGIIHAWCFLS